MISILPKVRKDISKVIFILSSANKKVFSKNQDFLSLSFNEKKNNYYSINLQPIAIDLLGANIGFSNMKPKFYCKT